MTTETINTENIQTQQEIEESWRQLCKFVYNSINLDGAFDFGSFVKEGQQIFSPLLVLFSDQQLYAAL